MMILIGDIIAYPAVLLAFIGMILVGIEPIIEYAIERRKQKAQRNEIEYDMRVWTNIAKSCDPVEDAEDKGYAIARLVLLNHELEQLEEKQKNDLCS